MFLAPSDVHYVRDSDNGLQEMPEEALINKLSNLMLQNKGSFPTIQVVQKGGAYFALNNSYLHVFRELERRGKCKRMKVDLVPLSKVPVLVQKCMVTGQVETSLVVDTQSSKDSAEMKPGANSGTGES